MFHVARKSFFTYLWLLVVLLRPGWSHDISNDSRIDELKVSARGPTFLESIRLPRATSSAVVKHFCSAPPQPENGEWRRRQDICGKDSADCKVPEGTALGLGYQLNYSCKSGYKIEGNNIVSCKWDGDWSPIPICREIRCDPLNTVSRIARCSRSYESVDCDLPVLPNTRAEIFCQDAYTKDVPSSTRQDDIVNCEANGEWQPQPMTCSPDCGYVPLRPYVFNGFNAKIVDFAWHATLYLESKSSTKIKKDFLCGATIIRANLLLTAAHCVWDETLQVTTDPEKLFVMTKNIFRDYDHPMHDLKIVEKGMVKKVYLNKYYYGLRGHYASDIALLELQKPIVFSGRYGPACVDTVGENAPFLKSGALGRIAGFGRTATSDSSETLQMLTVPYIPYDECRVSKNAAKNYIYITADKFCAGYTNGSAVCEGDSGGGLVFKKGSQWYLMGIVSVGLGVDLDNGVKTCEKYAYSLYVRVSDHAKWISEIISDVEQSESRPPSRPNPESKVLSPTFLQKPIQTSTPASPTTSRQEQKLTPVPSSTAIPWWLTTTGPTPLCAPSFCLPPPQPTHGQWRLEPTHCSALGYDDKDCDIPRGVKLEIGSQLIYTCNAGYKPRGNTDVYCARGGIWSKLPECIEITCLPLNSASTIARCVDRSSNSTISCDYPVPSGTLVQLTCRPWYTSETNSTITLEGRHVVCRADGKWWPDPITCRPVCGRAIHDPNRFPLSLYDKMLHEFPWHASIYVKKNTKMGIKKVFLCGATIISANLLLTAAHCVHDERTNAFLDPRVLFVMTGNIFRNYDSTLHKRQLIKRNAVKRMSINPRFRKTLPKYEADFALLKLEAHFQLSETLLPACLDFSAYGSQIPNTNVNGILAGFGGTIEERANTDDGLLERISVPYLLWDQCNNISKVAGNEYNISTRDKFCAGYNGSHICDGDDGGGLVFYKNGRWYVLGIMSMGFGDKVKSRNRTCETYSYALYTSVYYYAAWIRNSMFFLAHNTL